MTFCLFMMGDAERAVTLGQRALGIATALRDFPLQVSTSLYLGQAYHDLGDYRQAMDILRETMETLEGELLQKHLGMASLPAVGCRTWLVWCLAELGDFTEGIAPAAEGVRIAEAINHPFNMTFASVGSGILYLHPGIAHQAITVLERGLEVCRVWHIPLMFPWGASALGAAYTLAGRVSDALPLLERAVEQASALGIMGRQALQLVWLREAYMLGERMEQAIALAECALELARQQREQGHQAYALRLLGEIAARRDPPESEQAAAYYRQALVLAEELGMHPLVAHCHRGLGMLYLKRGREAQASPELSAALDLYRTMDMTFWLPQTEAALTQVHEAG
jgi:tetratricopeptide (TPR) repeat protein